MLRSIVLFFTKFVLMSSTKMIWCELLLIAEKNVFLITKKLYIYRFSCKHVLVKGTSEWIFSTTTLLPYNQFLIPVLFSHPSHCSIFTLISVSLEYNSNLLWIQNDELFKPIAWENKLLITKKYPIVIQFCTE